MITVNKPTKQSERIAWLRISIDYYQKAKHVDDDKDWHKVCDDQIKEFEEELKQLTTHQLSLF